MPGPTSPCRRERSACGSCCRLLLGARTRTRNLSRHPHSTAPRWDYRGALSWQYTVRVATRDPQTAKAMPLRQLIELLDRLDRGGLTGVEAVKAARQLAARTGPMQTTLQAVGDAAVARAKAETGWTQERLATELGYGSRARITDALKRHKRRLRGEL